MLIFFTLRVNLEVTTRYAITEIVFHYLLEMEWRNLFTGNRLTTERARVP